LRHKNEEQQHTRAGIKTNREYPYRQNSCTRPAGAEKYLRITYRQRGTTVT